MLRYKILLPLALAVTGLSGCGSNTDPAPATQRTASKTAAQVRSAADYRDVTQQIYIAYFGRPADPGGLEWYSARLLDAQAPTDIAQLSNAYFVNPGVRAVIDSFATSKESSDLYTGDTGQFLEAVYKYVLNRPADPAGKQYWLETINSGALTRAAAAISIMSGARGSDLDIVNNKTRVAANFTSAADTPLRRAGYGGLEANVVVRTMLGGVSATTDPTAFQPTVTATLDSLGSAAGANARAKVMDVVGSQCMYCHSSPPPTPGAPASTLVSLDSESAVRANAARIYQAAAVNKTMPPAGTTTLSDDERAALVRWYELGTP